MKTNSVPKIRFKGFTDDWEQRKLESLCEVFTDGDWIEAKDQSNSGVRLIQTGNIGITEYLDKENNKKWISEETLKRLRCEEVYPGDILISRLPDPAGRACILPNLGIRMITAVDCTIIRTSKEYDSKYLVQYLSTPTYFKIVNSFLGGGTRQRISRKNLSKIDIPVPHIFAEQQKIGEYFLNLDRLITLHQRKCDQTKELKKFMLQKMFPKKGEKNPEIRFSGFTDDWEQRKLGELGRATGGTSIESEFSENGKYKVISIGSYSEDSVYREQGIRAIESEKTKNRVLNEGDLTMILNDKTTSGNIIGRVLLIEKSDVYVYNQRTERIEINHDKFDSLFVYEMLNAPQIRNKIIKQSQGNTQIYVNWPTIAETRYLIPQIVEQQKIGEYFLNLDRLITLHQRKCEQLKELKKFMLQNMFPKKG